MEFPPSVDPSTIQKAPSFSSNISTIKEEEQKTDTLDTKHSVNERTTQVLIKEFESPKEAPSLAHASLATRIKSLPNFARKISIKTTKDGEITLTIPPKKITNIPHDAGTKLEAWLNKHEKENGSIPTRIPYDQNEIAKAHHEFQNKYECSWALMKANCKDPKTLQIVNDTRAAYLEEVFGELREEFPKLNKINDFGSSKLTSDRDFAFSVGEGQQSVEGTVVKRFNELFEARWGAPSAIVFDSNAYTMQYLLTARDPAFETERSQLQQEGSLLMYLRTAPKEDWENFKASVLKNCSDPEIREKKAEEFDRVEKQEAQLKDLFYKEIVRLGSTSSSEQDLEHISREDLQSAAQTIIEHNPGIEVKANNSLHEKLKLSYQNLETQRANLVDSLIHMEKAATAGDPKIFAEEFNSAIDQQIESLNQQIQKAADPLVKMTLESTAENLKNSKVTNTNERPVMDAYNARSGVEKREMELHTERSYLEGQVIRLPQLLAGIKDLETKRTKTSNTSEDLSSINKQLNQKKLEVENLKNKYGIKDLEHPKELQDKMKELDGKLDTVQVQKEKLSSMHGEAWDIAGRLGNEADRQLVSLQRADLLAMAFANEAHFSHGAFAVVVLNMQSGAADIRTPNQYLQAFREVNGFYSGHQLHQHTPREMIIEGSKYAERLMVINKTLQVRAKALNVKPPEVDAGITKLEGFFKSIAPLRGGAKGKTEIDAIVDQAAKENGFIEKTAAFDDSSLAQINAQMLNLGVTLELWKEGLPEKLQNAYYV